MALQGGVRLLDILYDAFPTTAGCRCHDLVPLDEFRVASQEEALAPMSPARSAKTAPRSIRGAVCFYELIP